MFSERLFTPRKIPLNRVKYRYNTNNPVIVNIIFKYEYIKTTINRIKSSRV